MQDGSSAARDVGSHPVLPEQVEALAVPHVAAAGLDLLDVAVKGAGRERLVRVVVDRKGGVDLGTCQGVSRALADDLDALDGLDGTYRLEVTSPGVDAPLRDRGAFDRVEGRPVLVRRDAGDGRIVELRGTVTTAGIDAVVLDVDGDPVDVPYSEISTATQRLPW